jgi:hypothetical protein
MAEESKKRGRPEKPKAERRIKSSSEGRLRFKQGDPHALDVQLDEARRVGQQLTAAAEPLPALVASLEEYQQAPARLAAEDEDLAAFLGEHYSDRKHVDHIQATLMIFRRKRALARIQAAEAALRLAQELLAPDPLIPRLVELLQAGPGPTARAKVDREQLTGSPRLLDEQLDQVKNHLHEIQAAFAQGNGWIEMQYIKRERVRQIIVQYVIALNKQRDDGTPVPPALEREIDPVLANVIKQRREIPEELEPLVYETYSYGPYPFFRWREGKGPIYAISLADVTVEMPERFRMGGFFAIRTRTGITTVKGKPV